LNVSDEKAGSQGGSGSRYVCQSSYESADPDPNLDPYQNVTDPQHWLKQMRQSLQFCSVRSKLFLAWPTDFFYCIDASRTRLKIIYMAGHFYKCVIPWGWLVSVDKIKHPFQGNNMTLFIFVTGAAAQPMTILVTNADCGLFHVNQ
jgi:hypothetical protein